MSVIHSRVTTTSPMNRGLKDSIRSYNVKPASVTTTSPMNRGLKVFVKDHGDIYVKCVTTTSPMNRGLKELIWNDKCRDVFKLQPLPR